MVLLDSYLVEEVPEHLRVYFDEVPPVNINPCVKPIAINRYLATLLLPPPVISPRRILVPFAGVGSEMIGAMVAGWDEIVGIEREATYVPIAKARLAWWAEHPDGVPEQPSAVMSRAKAERGRSVSLDFFSDARMEES